ncbi:hypothetical protein [Amycolatopsis anabasis]|uniref:hypothetical protein n=1 Tax=Amycolatopsis anabasis TaxID=1840409 RepID=UPI00131E0FF1|nr:hypothetical protein [Amycolatopsis anabasis]
MRTSRKAAVTLALAGAFTAAATVPAHAETWGPTCKTSGFTLIAFCPTFGDSLLEVDRTLNSVIGNGSAGSDHDGEG